MPAPPPTRAEPLGVVLAGGAARRYGGRKMIAEHDGRPLVAWAVGVVEFVTREVVVMAKGDVELPPLDAEVWIEPDEPRHPLAGIAFALERAGRPVLVCAGDMPWVPAALLAMLATRRGPAAIARGPEGIEPLLGRYAPAIAWDLMTAARQGLPAREAVEMLDPTYVDWPDPDALRSLNSP
jgi:molybdenum cofactor guanylyltransferase